METAVAGLTLAGALLGLLKIGFLIWAYIRTKLPATVVYAVYLLTAPPSEILISNFMMTATTGSENSAGIEMATNLIVIRVVFALAETGLFVWLIQSLLNRSTTHDDR